MTHFEFMAGLLKKADPKFPPRPTPPCQTICSEQGITQSENYPKIREYKEPSRI